MQRGRYASSPAKRMVYISLPPHTFNILRGSIKIRLIFIYLGYSALHIGDAQSIFIE